MTKESTMWEMTTHGQIGEFHGDLETWTSYMELRGQQCGQCWEAMHNPPELLRHLHIQADSETGRAKQTHSHLQGLGGESHQLLCSKALQDCLQIQVKLTFIAAW